MRSRSVDGRALEVRNLAHILVVDDSAVDRRLVGAVLEQSDEWEVSYAENGRQALEKIETTRIDVVVTDLQMPELDGLELVRALVQRRPTIPIVLITSNGSEKLAIEALKAGASSYSPKHALKEDLVPTLRTVLASAVEEERKERVLQRRVRHAMHFVLENDNSLIGPLVEFLQQQLIGWEEADRLRIGIALDETLVNAMYHGNLEVGSDLRQDDESEYYKTIELRAKTAPYSHRKLTVDAEFGPDWLRVRVEDEGPGFDPDSLPDPTDPENLERVSGRGLLLIRTFMDEVTFSPRGNAITMFKRRVAAGESGDGDAAGSDED
ncbi:MAG TPA: response regulator receiver protein [Planctomycetaceae bacterium]|nr:response regulator receiver protein [Planctomycetaceae bacterium]